MTCAVMKSVVTVSLKLIYVFSITKKKRRRRKKIKWQMKKQDALRTYMNWRRPENNRITSQVLFSIFRKNRIHSVMFCVLNVNNMKHILKKGKKRYIKNIN
jgi:hypothetical protein